MAANLSRSLSRYCVSARSQALLKHSIPSITCAAHYGTFRERKTTRWKLLGSLAGVGVGSLLLWEMNKRRKDWERNTTLYAKTNDPPEDNARPTTRATQFNFIADAVETAAPGVVAIKSSSRGNRRFMMMPVEEASQGSGFIASVDGVVLTNAHVVSGTRQVVVSLENGCEYRGDVIAVDTGKDLAAIQIRPKEPLYAIPLGSSKTLRSGEWVIAMGSPLSFSNTVTAGIVSTVHRDIGNGEIGYIQTDAAINFGNSGGPLVNLDGEVIGMNTMTIQNATGISFAIPVHEIKDFLDRVKNAGGHERESSKSSLVLADSYVIGITMITLTPNIIGQLQNRGVNLHGVTSGVFVAGVQSRQPAHRAGIKSGDVIVKVNGEDVASSSELYQKVQQGGVLEVEYLRGNQRFTTTVYPMAIMH